MHVNHVLLCLSSAALILSSAVRVLPPSRGTELDKDGIEPEYFDGIDLNRLSENEIEELMDAEDEIMKGEFDIFGYRNSLLKKSHRPKRVIRVIVRALFTIGRALFRQFSKGKVTRSGNRLTRPYHRKGTFQDANRDFDSLNLSDVRCFRNGDVFVRTGTLGPHRVTVRSHSSSESPTLEIRSNGGTTLRQFRYND